VTEPRDGAVRAHVLELLRGGHAHATFERATEALPPALRGSVPHGSTHSPWQLVEHIRIAQHDILRFSTNDDGTYHSPPWPTGYWPATPAPPSEDAWVASLAATAADREAMEALVSDATRDLLAPFPWGSGQTLLREALMVADHTAYHVGELVTTRQLLGAWPP